MDNLPHTFFFYVKSNSSLEHFIENESNNFSNILFNPINADEYTVSLAELYFVDNYDSKPPPIQTTTTETPRSWFHSATRDNKILIQRQVEKVIEIYTKDLNMTQLLLAIDKKLSERMASVKIKSLNTLEGIKTSLVFKDISGENYSVELQSELSEILGFTSTIFQGGYYSSHLIQNEEALKKYSNLDSLSIRLFKWTTDELIVGEPSESTNLEDMLEIISEQFKLLNYEVRFVVSPDSLSIFVEIDTPKLKFKLPIKVNELLGKPKDYIFEVSEKVVLPILKGSELEIPVIVVICNLVNETQIGGVCKSVIRIFQRPSSPNGLSMHHALYFTSLQQHSLKRKEFKFINIRLEDAKGNLIASSKYPTAALLQFKRI